MMCERPISVAGGWIVLVVCLACGSQPVPRAVLTGTSFTVMLSGENLAGENSGSTALDAYDVGYGSEWAAQAGFQDRQRGEIQFYLDDTNPENLLYTDFATRVFADPASDAATANSILAFSPFTDEMGLAQVQALVFVPCGVDPGERTLKARKVYRVYRNDAWEIIYPGDPDFPANFSWYLPYTEPITIVPGECLPENRSTPHMSFGGSGGIAANDPAATLILYPNPKLIVWLPSYDVLPPAAAHLEIQILDPEVTVVNVIEEQHYGRRSVVTWKMNGDTLEIDFVNSAEIPDVNRLAIVYQPGENYQRINPEDPQELAAVFQIDVEDVWDSAGAKTPPTWPAAIGPIR